MSVSATAQRSLDRRLAAEQRDGRLPSVIAAATNRSDLVWTGVAGSLDARGGPAPDSDTQFRLGSITKTFVAVEIMRLRDEGLLDLAAPAQTYLTEAGWLGGITVAQLLNHTSGMQAETDGPWWERTAGDSWAELNSSTPIARLTPGTQFHYSNVGYAALGEIVARLRQQPWAEAVRSGILQPLGLNRTTTRPVGAAAPGLAVHPWADLVHVEPEHDAGAMAPAGQLWSTITDLARWASFLAGDTSEVLAADTLAEMLTPSAVVDMPGQPWTGAHGLGWQMWNTKGVRYAGHGGSMPGFLAGLNVNLETGNGVCILTNSTGGLGPALPQDLLAIVDEDFEPAISPWLADHSEQDALDLTGPWFWGPYRFDLALHAGGSFTLGKPGEGRGSLFDPVEGQWIGRDGYFTGEPLRVERNAEGRPTRLWLASFVLTRTPYEPGSDTPGGLDPAGWS